MGVAVGVLCAHVALHVLPGVGLGRAETHRRRTPGL